MSVQHLNPTGSQFMGQPPHHPPIAAGPPPQVDDLDAFRLQLLAEGADGVEAEDHRVETSGQPADRFRDKHFRAGDLHHVHDKAESEWGGVPAAPEGVGRCVQ